MLTIIGSDHGLSPGRRQAIIWTNAVILLIRTLGTNLSEILCEIHSFSFSKMHLKMSSATWRLFGLGLNELTHTGQGPQYFDDTFSVSRGKYDGCLCPGSCHHQDISCHNIANISWQPITCPWGQDMGFILWNHANIYILWQLLLCLMQYHDYWTRL